jgi:hypothetical protein
MKNTKEIDEIVAAIMVKKLIQDIKDFDAYKAGIIDIKGDVVNKDRVAEISQVELLSMILKKYLGGRVNLLRPLFITISMVRSVDLYNKLVRTVKINPSPLRLAFQRVVDYFKR